MMDKDKKKITYTFKLNTRNIVKIGMLSAVAFLLMLIQFPIPTLFPFFLELDISELPALLGGFTLGPIAGSIIVLLKNLLLLAVRGSKTSYVGELSNFIVGAAFVVPASILYINNKSKRGAIYSLIAGILGMTIVACISNYYLIIPLFSKTLGFESVMEMAARSNKAIVDMKTYILYAVVPFNILKSMVVSIFTLLIYKRLSPLLRS
ncbi:MAG: ECF transporter S component [Caldicoprobacterales bacterium]|jgi:riboflavin transporter FmnP|nr:ECF transporter S component [Clostridia bacterium]MDI9513085.1 ECF transporter S component [Bacillota bacterium]